MEKRRVLAMSVPLKPKALILTGDGINCEIETKQAFLEAQFDADIFHMNDLISQQMDMDQLSSLYQVVALPGGFSYGDDIYSGKILALKLKYGLKWDFNLYVKRGGLVLGICNGFQALIRLGLFTKEVSITHNQGGAFINRWVKVTPHSKKSVWMKGLGTIDLPIRHGEGRIVFQSDHKSEVLAKLDRMGMMCLQYTNNPNGSEESLAGLCDISGRILGMMPHPEAFVRWTAHPEWTKSPDRAGAPGDGLLLFKNAYEAALAAL